MTTIDDPKEHPTQPAMAAVCPPEPPSVGTLARDVEQLKADTGQHRAWIVELQNADQNIRADVSTLKADMGSVKADVGSMKSDVSTLKGDMSTVKSDVGSVKTTVESIGTNLSEFVKVAKDTATNPTVRKYAFSILVSLSVILGALAMYLTGKVNNQPTPAPMTSPAPSPPAVVTVYLPAAPAPVVSHEGGLP